MTIRFERDPDNPSARIITAPRGEPFALVLKFAPTSPLFEQLQGREWRGQLRLEPELTGDPVAVFEQYETVNADDADNDPGWLVIVLALLLGEAAKLANNRTYYADVEVLDGPPAGMVFYNGSRVIVSPDVSRG